jgi:hypothetical protein
VLAVLLRSAVKRQELFLGGFTSDRHPIRESHMTATTERRATPSPDEFPTQRNLAVSVSGLNGRHPKNLKMFCHASANYHKVDSSSLGRKHAKI